MTTSSAAPRIRIKQAQSRILKNPTDSQEPDILYDIQYEIVFYEQGV